MLAFEPQGPVLGFTADATAPTSVDATPITGLQSGQVMFTNTSSSVDAVIGWGTTDAIAKANAATPFAGCVQQYYLLRGTQVVVSATGPHFTGIAASPCICKVQAGTGN